MSKLLTCPLCGEKASLTKLPHHIGKTTFNISCGVKDDYSDTCGLVMYGDSKETEADVIAKWNRRTSPQIQSR